MLDCLDARLQGAPVQDHGAGPGLAPARDAQQFAQVADDGLEAARLDPAARLLVDGVPGRQVVRQVAPGGARARQPAQSVEDIAQRVVALGRGLCHQGQVRGHEGPLILGNVRGIRFASVHTRKTPAKTSKFITLSNPLPREERVGEGEGRRLGSFGKASPCRGEGASSDHLTARARERRRGRSAPGSPGGACSGTGAQRRRRRGRTGPGSAAGRPPWSAGTGSGGTM